MDDMIDCGTFRRFGVEVELNTLDGVVRKLDPDKRDKPYGADLVAEVIHKATGERAEIQCWEYNYYNNTWIVKSDSSCGIEVCSPVLKGWRGLKSLCKAVTAFRDSGLTSDDRCSLHVHVDIKDLNEDQLASVIAWYVKCEHVFFDSVPARRKVNRYCQCIGTTDLFWHDFPMDPMEIIYRVSKVKYYSLNCYHFVKGGGFTPHNDRKKTVEFRIMENDACLDPVAVKNWVRLLLHFVDVVKDRPIPEEYRSDSPWTGLLWLDPTDVFKVLKFDQPLSPGMSQVRQWFMMRLLKNSVGSGLPGIWSDEARIPAKAEYEQLYGRLVSDYHFEFAAFQPEAEAVFGKKYVR